MKASSELLKAILRILHEELEHLRRFLIVFELTEDLVGQAGNPMSEVLTEMSEASKRALMLGLAGLLSSDQESITLTYLLDHARNHPYDFELWSPEKVQVEVEKAGLELHSINGLELRLRALRDRRLAHIDRKHINDPELMDGLDLGSDEAAQILGVIERIVSDFHRGYCGERLSLAMNQAMLRSEYAELVKYAMGSKR